ncbi:MAG: nickel pincer cofactor biosynthesis protein LarB [Actinobacteria bacterium]|nr:nickel pincer cofactor biosynthesis protein LarB [Actinomycetota bacterium]
MNNNLNDIIEEFLEDFKNGKISKDDFKLKIKEIYFEDIGFAKIDHHRKLRKGFPEVVYGANKTPYQILEITKKFLKYTDTLLITRTNKEVFNLIQEELDNIYFVEEAQIIYVKSPEHDLHLIKGVTVVCAGTSDIPIAEEACITSYLMGNDVRKIYDVGIAGIHRLLNYKDEILKSNVVIAVAGMEGALPGLISSLVDCPVIGVPTSVGYGASFKGISPLLTMLNSCSPGLSVVNIDNGFGAGYIASLINKKINLKS